jgi:hypothetical protein
MPPLWLIIGAISTLGLASLVDQLILKPRGHTVIVDGRMVSVRRKRDVQLLMTITMAAGIVVFVSGSAFLEGDMVFGALAAIPFAGFVAWTLWRAYRESDSPPTENDVGVGTRTTKVVNRHARQAFIMFAVEFALTTLVRITDGILSWIVLLLGLALLPVVVWHTWQFLRALREIGSESQSS